MLLEGGQVTQASTGNVGQSRWETQVGGHHGTASTNSNAMAWLVLDLGTGEELSHQP